MANNRIAVAQIEGTWSSADTTATSIDGYTTDPSHYILVRCTGDARHAGAWSTSKYHLSVSADTALRVMDQYVRLDGLQVEVSSGTANSQNSINIYSIAAGGSEFQISNCIARTHTNASYYASAIAFSDTDITVGKLWNTVAENRTGSGSANNVTCASYATTFYGYNVTFYGGYQGFRNHATSGTNCLRNCLATNTSNADFSGASGPTYDWAYCASEDATADDKGGSGHRISQTFTFTDAANTNFHLASSDAGAKDYGTDLSADPYLAFTTDIDGETRTGTWDIGADEYIAGGGPLTIDLADAMTLGEARTSGEYKVLAEALAMGEARVLAFTKALADALALGEARTSGEYKVLADALALGEAITKAEQKALADALTLGEAIAKAEQKLLADALTLGEARSLVLVLVAAVADALALGESASAKITAKGLADAMSLGETRALAIAKTLADSLGLSERATAALIGLVITAVNIWRDQNTLTTWTPARRAQEFSTTPE